jgi:uncharacterized protein (UPF0276 family)
MRKIYSAIACNLDQHVLQAALPLLEAEKIEAIEWSFDTLFKLKEVPEWFTQLLHAYSAEQRLIGHGVFFSLFSGKWSDAQTAWLEHLRNLCKTFHFDHITEHFGFMTGANFHTGAPMSIPFTPATLAIGRDRLARIYDACACPVGLENLAFSYTLEEVKRHGAFLEALLAPLNGFIILDLHNLYCQTHNFELPVDALLALYPLDRVREIHISGGSWDQTAVQPEKMVRRDTHDEGVPVEVFQFLEYALPRCPNLKFVVLEQLGIGLRTEASQALFQANFLKMDEIVKACQVSQPATNPFLPQDLPVLGPIVEDIPLFEQQRQLSTILETCENYAQGMEQLSTSKLANTAWEVEQWHPAMLETAIRIAQKWKSGF